MCTKSQQELGFASVRASFGSVVMNVRGAGAKGDAERKRGCREEKGGRKRQQREKEGISKVCALGGEVINHTVHSDQHKGTSPLTSFSPQMLLIMELEAGLEEGPSTPTTPLGRIWHTVGIRERDRDQNSPQIPADSAHSACCISVRTWHHLLHTTPSLPFPSQKSLYSPCSTVTLPVTLSIFPQPFKTPPKLSLKPQKIHF